MRTIIAALLIAAPAYADECDAYRAQALASSTLAVEVGTVGASLLAQGYVGEMSEKDRADLAEKARRLKAALTEYNRAAAETMQRHKDACGL